MLLYVEDDCYQKVIESNEYIFFKLMFKKEWE